MLVGRVLATPLWVFLFALALGVWGCIYVYRKAKRQFQKLREAIQKVDLSDRNFEITVMGGFLTMRVEQNPRRLLEAPPEPPVLDAEPVDTIETIDTRQVQ
jgi:phosphoglycerate-specific signal transduction histidine kinase